MQAFKILTQCTTYLQTFELNLTLLEEEITKHDGWREEEKWYDLEDYGGTGFQKANAYKGEGSEWDH